MQEILRPFIGRIRAVLRLNEDEPATLTVLKTAASGLDLQGA